jgi:hypothetical protein
MARLKLHLNPPASLFFKGGISLQDFKTPLWKRGVGEILGGRCGNYLANVSVTTLR